MKYQDIISNLLKIRGVTQQQLADKCKYKSQSNISSLLRKNKQGIGTDLLVEILNALDCELVIRSKINTEKQLQWVLTLNETDENVSVEDTENPQKMMKKIQLNGDWHYIRNINVSGEEVFILFDDNKSMIGAFRSYLDMLKKIIEK